MTSELNTLSATYLPAIEAEMRAVLNLKDNGSDRADPFYGMIHYHMGWADEELNHIDSNSGKRIRPILCLLACAAAGGEWRQAVPAAAAVEILHNFSLVHDDIQDNSPTRRGRPTVWTLWGAPQAINTGDAMFALAHLALAGLAERGASPEVIVRALRRFDDICVALTRGQHADMSFEALDRVSVDEYLVMITGKTAALLSLCTELGALVAGADDSRIEHFKSFGLNLGLAFQIQDDILGIWGDETITGKSAATDIATRKKTLPVLYALASRPELRELYEGSSEVDDFVPRAVAELGEAGAQNYAVSQAAYYSDSARTSLAAAHPAEPAAAALQQLTDMLLRRDF
jgi:geranylgeranyl diphosphate synthase type I